MTAVSFILAGSTFGVILRIFVRNNFKKKLGFNINHVAIVNIFAVLFLGGLLALNFTNTNIILFFYVGFLGCFSTFSSFIYDLFQLFQTRQYFRLFFSYIEILILSFLFFLMGFLIISIF